MFNVGDFITVNPWVFTLKITKIDSGNGQFETIKGDGYDDKDIYYIVPYEETPKSKDCEADPRLIVSGQVKKFYDLNKTRIEKLKSEFSCNIIKALVSLPEYEKCGSPSKIKLPSAKEDLFSEIKNLKL